MTPSRSRSDGAGARIQAPTAREAIPYEDEEEWLPPDPAPVPAEEEDGDSPTGAFPASASGEAVPTPGDDQTLAVLTERIEAIEERLAVLEDPEGPRPPSEGGRFWDEHVAAGEVAALRQEVSIAMDQVSRLATEVSGTQQRSDERFAATELRLAAVDALVGDVGAVERKLTELGRAQVAFQEALTSHPGLRSAQRSVDQLRGELTAVHKLLRGLETRVEELKPDAAAMEEVAARQFERLMSEMLSLPVDIEGIYREMDSIAERMTAREDAAAVAAERAGFAAEAVMAVRHEVEGVREALAEIRAAQEEAWAWRERLERRLAALADDAGADDFPGDES